MNIQIGDSVKILNGEKSAKGKVEETKRNENLIKVNGDWYVAENDLDIGNEFEVVSVGVNHKHAPQQTKWGRTLYVCVCGARQQKSKIVDGKKVEVWKVESKSEATARERAIEMLQTEGYRYDSNQSDTEDQYDGGRGAGSLGQPID